MTKKLIIERTVKAINDLPQEKAEEISAFVDFIFQRYEAQQLLQGIQIAAIEKSEQDLLREQFKEYHQKWKETTPPYSSKANPRSNIYYQKIIGLGTKAIPLILESLIKKNDHWIGALMEITGANPVPDEDRGNIEKMKQHWIKWATENSYWP